MLSSPMNGSRRQQRVRYVIVRTDTKNWRLMRDVYVGGSLVSYEAVEDFDSRSTATAVARELRAVEALQRKDS